MMGFIAKTGMRVIPALISFIFLMLFIAPFFSGIVNLGNCVGTAVSTVLLVIFVFFKKFCSIIAGLWGSTAGRIIVCTSAAAVIICTAAAITMTCFMIRAAYNRPESSNTTVVVLGCQVKGTGPSYMLRKRLNAAYEYLSENEEVMVIVSGGKGDDEQISEALCMKNYLVEKGIDPSRIIMEDKSASTAENLEFSKDIIVSRGLPEEITIVTDGYHQLRAKILAERLDMQSRSISAPTSLWLIPTYWVREWFGILYFSIFG